MECKICQNVARHVKTLQVRKKYDAEYYLCDSCGFLFIKSPFWLNEAYNEPINITDTGYVLRNVYLSRKTLLLFSFLFGVKKTFLDFAGGYGIFSRLMRDYGFNFLLFDTFTQNIFMKGFEYNHEKIHALTCFECFEHFSNPGSEIDALFAISPNIFFSTVLFSGESAPPDDWEYYGLHHGQHIAFYSLKTLKYIAKKQGVYLCSNGSNLHLYTKKMVHQFFFKIILSLTVLQADALLKKFLKSKTITDCYLLIQQGKI